MNMYDAWAEGLVRADIFPEEKEAAGSEFILKKWPRYKGTVDWKVHCTYYKVKIFRAYHKENGRPCALYGAYPSDVMLTKYDNGRILLSENLDGIKAQVRRVMGI